jgi:MFS family permease
MGRTHVWQLYLMNTLVAAGFWMFWPTITALIQELTPEGEFIKANTFLLAGIQGGWLIAGSIVGFVYEHIGLGGVLLIDFSTYVVSFLCYLAVRKGHHVVPRPAELKHDILAAETAVERFGREMREGLHFLRDHRRRTGQRNCCRCQRGPPAAQPAAETGKHPWRRISPCAGQPDLRDQLRFQVPGRFRFGRAAQNIFNFLIVKFHFVPIAVATGAME